jgi:hypothetical protein
VKRFATIVLMILPALAAPANGTPITSAADPSLSGAVIVDFNATPLGNYASLTTGALTTSGPLAVLNNGNCQYVLSQGNCIGNFGGTRRAH